MGGEAPPIWAGIALLAAGIFCVFCAAKDYDWFMESRKARPLVTLLKRKGARIFYILLGALITVAGALMAATSVLAA